MLQTDMHAQEPIDLDFCVRRLRTIPYQGTGHRGLGILHEPELRMVLIGLAEGGSIERHSVEGRVAMQVLSGQVRLRMDRRSVTLSPGQVVSLPPGKPHEIEGLYESVLLLSLVPSFEIPKR